MLNVLIILFFIINSGLGYVPHYGRRFFSTNLKSNNICDIINASDKIGSILNVISDCIMVATSPGLINDLKNKVFEKDRANQELVDKVNLYKNKLLTRPSKSLMNVINNDVDELITHFDKYISSENNTPSDAKYLRDIILLIKNNTQMLSDNLDSNFKNLQDQTIGQYPIVTSDSIKLVNFNDEKIVIKNISNGKISMTGCYVSNQSKSPRETFILPNNLILNPDEELTIFTCPGDKKYKVPSGFPTLYTKWITKNGTLRKSKLFIKSNQIFLFNSMNDIVISCK